MTILRPHALRGRDADLSCEPFFIVTSGRSGSTLLRAILNQEPSICIPPESHVIGQVARRYKRLYRFLPWEYAVRLVGTEFEIQVPGFGFWKLRMHDFYRLALALPESERSLARLIDLLYVRYREEHKPGATRWGDKSIRNAFSLPLIDELFPRARYVLLIRDGRDVAVSLVAADTTPVTDVHRAGDYWRRSVKAARQFLGAQGAGRSIEIFYEDLVRRPQEVVGRIYEFLDLAFRPEVLDISDGIAALGDADRDIHRNLRKPINANSIGNWKKRLEVAEQRSLQALLADDLAELGYALD